MVRVQPHRFALHFEVPAVAHGAATDFSVLGQLGRLLCPVDIADPDPQRLQLLNQRFERLADPPERCRALLHQLELDPSLALRGFSPAHALIVPYDRRSA